MCVCVLVSSRPCVRVLPADLVCARVSDRAGACLTSGAGLGGVTTVLPWGAGRGRGAGSSSAGVQVKHVVGPCLGIGVQVGNLGGVLVEERRGEEGRGEEGQGAQTSEKETRCTL